MLKCQLYERTLIIKNIETLNDSIVYKIKCIAKLHNVDFAKMAGYVRLDFITLDFLEDLTKCYDLIFC